MSPAGTVPPRPAWNATSSTIDTATIARSRRSNIFTRSLIHTVQT
jgi:hypothetical protein